MGFDQRGAVPLRARGWEGSPRRCRDLKETIDRGHPLASSAQLSSVEYCDKCIDCRAPEKWK